MKFPLYCPCIKHNICLKIGYPYIFFMIRKICCSMIFTMMLFMIFKWEAYPWNQTHTFLFRLKLSMFQPFSPGLLDPDRLTPRWEFQLDMFGVGHSALWCGATRQNTADVAGDMRDMESWKNRHRFSMVRFSLSNLSDKERTKHVRCKP